MTQALHRNGFSSITKGSKNVSKIHKLTKFSGLSDKFQIRALMIKSEVKLISVMQTCFTHAYKI